VINVNVLTIFVFVSGTSIISSSRKDDSVAESFSEEGLQTHVNFLVMLKEMQMKSIKKILKFFLTFVCA